MVAWKTAFVISCRLVSCARRAVAALACEKLVTLCVVASDELPPRWKERHCCCPGVCVRGAFSKPPLFAAMTGVDVFVFELLLLWALAGGGETTETLPWRHAASGVGMTSFDPSPVRVGEGGAAIWALTVAVFAVRPTLLPVVHADSPAAATASPSSGDAALLAACAGDGPAPLRLPTRVAAAANGDCGRSDGGISINETSSSFTASFGVTGETTAPTPAVWKGLPFAERGCEVG